MRLLTFIATFLLVGLACSAPTTNEDIVIVDEEFFPESLVKYTAQHDIVNILVPLNALNFEDDTGDEDDNDNSDTGTTLFFVEADIKENGERVDQGLYVLKNGQATKLLDHGRESAASNEDTKTVFFATKDGIYSYNAEKNKAEKYGTVTGDFISIAKVNGSDVIYVLTKDNVLYKVTEEGTKKEKVDKVVNAKQIVLDYMNNLYYYTTDKKVYVLIGDEVKKFEGLPENPGSISILVPPFVIDNGVPVVVDSKTYIAYENGTVGTGEFELKVKPTAYSMEATLVQYYAYNKKIYEYNILAMLFSELLTELKTYLEGFSDNIQSIATRSRGDLRA